MLLVHRTSGTCLSPFAILPGFLDHDFSIAKRCLMIDAKVQRTQGTGSPLHLLFDLEAVFR